MDNAPQTEQEWNQMARAESHKCPCCGEYIRFDEREIFLDRNLCAYCAQNIPKRG